MKEILKQLIVEYQEFVQRVNIISRDVLPFNDANYVLTGVRRSGKSFTMYQYIQQLLVKGTPAAGILYINFEDERLIELKAGQLNLILEAHQEIFKFKPVLFFDELQVIDGWEKFARRLADQHYRIYITGSNASMLSHEIATTLGGRYLVREISPFSFPEYLTATQITLEENWQYSSQRFEVRRSFSKYFTEGGFPEIALFQEKKLRLQNLYNKILFGDIIARYKIRNDFALKLIVKKLAEAIHDEISFNRIRHIVQSAGIKIGTATVIEYVGYLKESYLLFEARNFLAKTGERESAGKFYFIDNGILSLFLLKGETLLLENMVAIGLKQKYGDELYYLRRKYEVDFYIPPAKLMVQVAFDLDNPATEAREIKSMLSLASDAETHKMMIITLDHEKEIFVGNQKIIVCPVWKWLLMEY